MVYSGKKVLCVGIDGLPFTLINKYVEKGVFPNLKRILSKGFVNHQMDASIPDVSSTSWSSFFTGVNPGEHNIYGFMELKKGTYKLTFPNYLDVKAPSLWEMIDGNCNSKKSDISDRYKDKLSKNIKSIVLNIPQTYPALPFNGILTAGFVCPDLKKGTYPESAYNYLSSVGYMSDVDATKAKDDPAGFFDEVERALDKRLQSYLHFLNNGDYGLFIACITETDRVNHFFFDAACDESHGFHDKFISVYGKIDDIIGRLYDVFMEKTEGQGFFMTMSDHGFTPIKKEFYVNAWLREKGFLKLNRQREYFEQIDSGTIAFALEPARIYLNLEGSYPLGCLKKEDSSAIAAEIKDAMRSISDEDGSSVIKCVYERHEVYSGDCASNAPELVCVANDGYDLKGNLKKDGLFGKGPFTGMHTRHDAHCILPAGLKSAGRLKIEDLAWIILDNFLEPNKEN